MTIKTFFLSIIFCIIGGYLHSQNAKIAYANKDYNKLAYIDAINIYERVAEKGYKNEEMFKKLANSYYFNANFLKANKWYSALFALNNNQEAEYFFRYSNTLKSIGDYETAEIMLSKFYEKSSTEESLKAKSTEDYLNEIKLNSGRYIISNAEINSKFSDYGATFYKDKLIFTSARRVSGPSKNVFLWTNKYFSNLFQSNIQLSERLSDPEPFENQINSKFNESTAIFTKDGLTMYFTRNNFLNGKRGSDKNEIMLLKLYKATLADGKWTNITELPFNSDQYSCAHPALSLDEKTLYFASNMPGSIGESDLFKVEIHQDNSYGNPENLGKTINTQGSETFPFISKNNELYFSSNGHFGLGGLDVFLAPLQTLSKVINVGEPVNSKQDDFAFYIDTFTSKGFFSSNREGGKGDDDIYKLTEIRNLNNWSEISGFINDKDDNAQISNAKVILFDNNYKLVDTFETDESGFYKMNLEANKVFYVRYQKEGFETKESAIATGSSMPINMPIFLEKLIKPVKLGTDLASTINIASIYFDVDNWKIKKESEFELQKIVEILKTNKNIRIEIRSHTDSRHSKDYNFTLSNKRAKATKDWLIKKGVKSEMLRSKGFGESELFNHCSDGIKCSEKEHQANRRSEFIIVSID